MALHKFANIDESVFLQFNIFQHLQNFSIFSPAFSERSLRYAHKDVHRSPLLGIRS